MINLIALRAVGKEREREEKLGKKRENAGENIYFDIFCRDMRHGRAVSVGI